MGYYVSNLIGIRVGGVFSPKMDIKKFKEKVKEIVLSMRNTEYDPDLGNKAGNVSHCISKELEAHKGSYIVIGGVFNYWTFDIAQEFSKRLSKEFGTHVLHACWDEETNKKQFEIFFDGKNIDAIEENPIEQIIRRII